MKFIDEVKVFLKAGNGGDGALSFRREKYIEFGGPDGGCGGNGGSIIFHGDQNINTLLKFRYTPHIKAASGKNGSGACKTGESGQNFVCRVPLGTQVIDEEGNLLCDISKNGQTFCAAQGGRGGRGNSTFKNSQDRAPRAFSLGTVGEEKTIVLKLKILADVGLVGFPNAGKSTFLSLCSNARPKIADYPFSTLSPNLGIAEVEDSCIVIADIPGIIEGAHTGVGLGDKFLKHIERCKVLLYVLDIGTDDIFTNYEILRKELCVYGDVLQNKPHLIVLTKCDLYTNDFIAKKVEELKNKINTQICLSGLNINLRDTLLEVKQMYEKLKGKKEQPKYDPFFCM